MSPDKAIGLMLIIAGLTIVVPGIVDAVRRDPIDRMARRAGVHLEPWQREIARMIVAPRRAGRGARHWTLLARAQRVTIWQQRIAGFWIGLGLLVLVGWPLAGRPRYEWFVDLDWWQRTGALGVVAAIAVLGCGVTLDLARWRASERAARPGAHR